MGRTGICLVHAQFALKYPEWALRCMIMSRRRRQLGKSLCVFARRPIRESLSTDEQTRDSWRDIALRCPAFIESITRMGMR